MASPLDRASGVGHPTAPVRERRAKIVCTLGPATSGTGGVRALVDAGMDVARLNMSHGTHRDHAGAYQEVRDAAAASGQAVAVLADLQGPKIRLGRFLAPPVLVRGQRWTITTRAVDGDGDIASTSYAGLPGDVVPGDAILVDDGRVRLRVVEVGDTDVVTEVVVGGTVSDHKGINLPGVAVSVPALSEKDVVDLRFALRLGVDAVALSFVRSAADADDVRAVMAAEGIRVPVIAKIEKPQAVDEVDAIVRAFDGVMVARGDLGVECPLEVVPLLQKQIIVAARRNARPVIVATQMLESMMVNPAPTRAETSDVANAVLDGADAVMLSGETSVGAHPLTAVETMARVIAATERHALGDQSFGRFDPIAFAPRTSGGVITKAAEEVAERTGARYVVAFTQSGDTARRMARLRGAIPVLAFTPDPKVRAQLALTWGVETFLTAVPVDTDDMVAQVDHELLRSGRGAEGDLVVIVAGSPPGVPGTTNALWVHRIGAR